MLSLKAVYVKNMQKELAYQHCFCSTAEDRNVASFQVAQITVATLFDYHTHTLCSYHMFLNLRPCQIYILDIFDICDLCKFVSVYVFLVIKDAIFTVI